MNMCVKPDSSPRSWSYLDLMDSWYYIYDECGHCVAETENPCSAKMIVDRMNSRAALVEALEKIYSSHQNVDTERLTIHCECFACSIARAALAAAKGEKA